MSKRKKYNDKLRLQKIVKGAVIQYKGEKNIVSGKMANGLPMAKSVFMYLREQKFCWEISLVVHANKGANVKTLPETFHTGQAVNINDLTDYVHEINTKLMLEMPAGFKFKCLTWDAKVL